MEREGEIALLDTALSTAGAGTGALVVIDGPAGIGKTALVEVARERAAAMGFTVLAAGAAVLEQEVGFGVVRQLFDPILRPPRRVDHACLFDGAARLALPALEASAPGATVTEVGDQRGAALHGLYWLTANLAETRPVLLAVDDAHWADPSSERYLAYLARRLRDIGVLVMMTNRTGEMPEGSGWLAELAASCGALRLRPGALSSAAVGSLVRACLGTEPDEAFIQACHTATGGVPYLVHELVRGLADAGIAPLVGSADQIARVAPATLAQATLLRLSRLAPAATRMAQAVSVLGRHAHAHLVAGLAGVPDAEVLAVADVLVAAHVFRPGRPLAFAHPLVAAAVYDDLGAGACSLLHAEAAGLLGEHAADPEDVAAHLLATEPAADPTTVERLQAAARLATERGAPEAAVAYLRRAAAETMPEHLRAALMHRLGRAEAVLRDPAAVAHLREAARLADDHALRAAATRDLVEVLVTAGQWQDALGVIERTLAEWPDGVPDYALGLEVQYAALAAYDPRLVGRFDQRRPRLAQLARRDRVESQQMAVLLASIDSQRIEHLESVAGTVERALSREELKPNELWMPQAVAALVFTGDLDRAQVVVEELRLDARDRGSVYGHVVGDMCAALLSTQRGELAKAEAELANAFALTIEHDLWFVLPSLLFLGKDAVLERPGLAELAAAADKAELEAGFGATFSGAWLREVRGALRLAAGDSCGAVIDLRSCGEIASALHVRNPLTSAWRSTLAVALARSATEEATQLAAEELDLARATGLPRAEGSALRAAALVQGGQAGIDLLWQSVASLEGAGAPLEQARSLVELGAALRRTGQRAAAREPLRAGLDLAQRCGAVRLSAHAETELRATGAKPRRRAVSGRDALTPSEARVAGMAADGMTNRDIAQALFVSTKTIEHHLGQAYRKLGVTDRRSLADALHEAPAPPARLYRSTAGNRLLGTGATTASVRHRHR